VKICCRTAENLAMGVPGGYYEDTKERDLMTHRNPYVQTLMEMGYDEADCQTVAVAGLKKTFPLNIHGRVYNSQEEYDEALADFLNGM
jgi:hypothetical protein